jgi:hypothetical protein
MHADALFSDEHSLNTLFYEVLRNNQVFEKLNSAGSLFSSSFFLFLFRLSFPFTLLTISCLGFTANNGADGGAGSSSSVRVTSLNLVNIRQVHDHLQFKIEGWQKLNGNYPLSVEQVLALIHQSLDSMDLKKLERLEAFERYSEHPHHTPFFRSYLRLVVADTATLIEERFALIQESPPQDKTGQ